MNYLNLACGGRFHEDWTNIDFVSSSPSVLAHNLLTGIPFPENHFDAVYHSHVLGHFPKAEGAVFIKECYRVLKPGGTIRVVVPDFEQLAREYILALDNVMQDENEKTKANYQWSVIELIDEMVREKPGGEMLAYWQQKEIINEDQIVRRVGHEYLKIREHIVQSGFKTIPENSTQKNTLKSRIKKYLFKKLHVIPENLELGNFRNSGELFKWMYDRYSLSNLLTETGFKAVKVQTANDSYIIDWDKYKGLDMEGNRVRKPDSLFIEAKK